MSDLASARALLRAKDPKHGDLPSVYEHLSGVLLKLIKEKPKNPLAHFEALSVSIKQQRLKGVGGWTQEQVGQEAGGVIGIDIPAAPLVSDPALKAQVEAYLQKTQDMIKKPKKFNEDGEEEEEEEPEWNPAAPDLVQQALLLKEAGVSLRPFELHRLSISVQNLCNTTESLVNPRFWGKIYGTSRDYYIIEGKVDDSSFEEDEEEPVEEKREPDEGEEEEEEVEPPASRTEPWGIGANEYAYWASNSVDGPWTRLPKVTPEQIIAARGMRRFFTGNLTAAVFGFPRFPWGEASYLRTQIARITASTHLSPKGAFLSDEEEPLIALENEDFRGLRSSLLLSGENWAHSRPKLLGEGRVEAFVDENAEEEPDDDELDEVQREARAMERAKKEKPVAILTPASRDVLISSRTGRPSKRHLWKFQLSHAADTGAKPLPPPPAGVDVDDLPPDASTSHVVASAHSLLWPGAVSLAQNKTMLHVYVGYGLKQLNRRYKPVGPATPQSEYRPPTQPNKRGVIVNPIAECADDLPPPPEKDTRTEEEKEQEELEEQERIQRQLAEEGEPVEELEEEEEEQPKDEEED